NVSASSERTGAPGAANLQMGGAITVTAGPGVQFGGQSGVPAKAPITLAWQADDPNGDPLVYALYLKATDEREWHLLKDKIYSTTFTVDPNTLADGKYVARLVASDEQANAPNQERRSELISAPFWVDNTPPDITVSSLRVTGTSAKVQFVAQDA